MKLVNLPLLYLSAFIYAYLCKYISAQLQAGKLKDLYNFSNIHCNDIKKFSLTEIKPPLVYNAYVNSEEYGTFTCITRYSTTMRWIVDGYAHNRQVVAEERQISVYITQLDNSHISVIRIPAIRNNNNISSIKCMAYNTDDPYQEAESNETAQYNIQGLLDSPLNIAYKGFNSSHNIIEWMEPATLNITNIEPDIENYTICTNTTQICVNVTEANYLVQKYFVDIQLHITAWNIVGESNNSTPVMINACDTDIPKGGISLF